MRDREGLSSIAHRPFFLNKKKNEHRALLHIPGMLHAAVPRTWWHLTLVSMMYTGRGRRATEANRSVQACTDAPSVLGVSSTFRAPSTEHLVVSHTGMMYVENTRKYSDGSEQISTSLHRRSECTREYTFRARGPNKHCDHWDYEQH